MRDVGHENLLCGFVPHLNKIGTLPEASPLFLRESEPSKSRMSKPKINWATKRPQSQQEEGSLLFGLVFFILIGVLGYYIFSPKTYKSTIPGMSDARYNQCIQLGKEVMEARDKAEGGGSRSARESQKIWQRKYDQWARLCSMKTLHDEGYDLNGLPSSPLDWADLGK
ncbi:hypothetical protein [Nitrospina watsonii]|nr:hypothetical protein [Nitrospina watsonii]